jgi:hypothetical protein
MKTIATKGFAGQGLEAGVAAVAQATASKSAAQKVKYFGRMEGLKGLSAFQAQDELRGTMTGLIGSAARMQPGAMADEFVASRRSIPELGIAELMRASEGTSMLDLVETPEVSAQAKVDAYKQIARAGYRKSGSWGKRTMAEYTHWGTSWLFPKSWEADEWRQSAEVATRGMSAEELSGVLSNVLRNATGQGVRDGLRGNTLGGSANPGDRPEND